MCTGHGTWRVFCTRCFAFPFVSTWFISQMRKLRLRRGKWLAHVYSANKTELRWESRPDSIIPRSPLPHDLCLPGVLPCLDVAQFLRPTEPDLLFSIQVSDHGPLPSLSPWDTRGCLNSGSPPRLSVTITYGAFKNLNAQVTSDQLNQNPGDRTQETGAHSADVSMYGWSRRCEMFAYETV